VRITLRSGGIISTYVDTSFVES